MEASQFQFSKPRLLKLSYQENQDFKRDSDTVEVPIEIKPTIHYNKRDTKAAVELKIKIGKKSEETPFVVVIVMGAKFRWEKDDFSEEIIDKLLRKNAVSLLLSYARPIVATVTSQSRYPTYDLPYIDLTKEE